jgi:uncharacterized damage-inducible protein DinB
MFSGWLMEILEIELNKLKQEINFYKDEKDLWIIKGEISNSAGNLCLHLLGNLNHFIGHLVGGTGYQRDRENEFSEKDVPRAELNNRIDAVIEVIKKSLPKINDSDMNKTFPDKMGGKIREYGYTLIHITNHFDYHLGQINYHRRLIGGK